jgi:DNA-damage-inducible protein D
LSVCPNSLNFTTQNQSIMKSPSSSKRKPSLDEFGFEENGIMYWWASWYGDVLGYASLDTFQKPIQKAMQACATLHIDTSENFIETYRTEDGKTVRDYKLTRFACYLIAMNADGRKPIVARAQVYFAEQVEKINHLLDGSKDIERILIREEIKEGNLAMTSAAAQTGVKDFRMFMTEGYLGLYNKPIREVKVEKGVDEDENLYEYMGRTELAANLFRITMTEEKLKNSGIDSPFEAAAIHRKIGEGIRDMVKENTGKFPEELPVERKLNEVASDLRKAKKILNEKIEKKGEK